MPGLGSVWAPRAAYGTQAPRWGETPGPRSRDRARWDPEPALGLAIRPAGAWARVSGGPIRRRVGWWQGLPLARGGVRRVRAESARPMGPKPPGGGKPPAPGPAIGPDGTRNPALGLAIRPAGAWARVSGGPIRRRVGWGQGLPLARGGVRRVRAERWEMPLWGEVGWNFRRGLPQGFRGKTPFLKLFADAAVSC